jgi:hypothetical protein
VSCGRGEGVGKGSWLGLGEEVAGVTVGFDGGVSVGVGGGEVLGVEVGGL